MKNFWRTSSLTLAAGLAVTSLQAQEPKVEEERVVVVTASAEDEASAHDDQEKKVRVEVIQVDGDDHSDSAKIIEKVEQQLSKSDLPSDARRKIIDGVRKALEAKVGKAHSVGKSQKGAKQMRVVVKADEHGVTTVDADDVTAEVAGEVVLQDRAGKQQKIMLRQVEPHAPARLHLLHDDLHAKLLEELKAKGVDQQKIDDITKHLKDALGQAHIVVAPTLGESRYVLGVSIKSREEFEEGEESDDDEGHEPKESEGLVIESVMDDSAAAKAGLQANDTILSVDGHAVTNPPDLIAKVQVAGKEDRSAQLKIRRDGKELTMDVKPNKQSIGGLESLPMDLKEQLGKLPEGIKGGFVLPTPGQRFDFKAFAPGQMEEIDDLKEEMDEIKKELKEIKKLLKSLKDD